MLLKVLSKNDFKHCFQAWQRHWNACVQSEGKYPYSLKVSDNAHIVSQNHSSYVSDPL